MGSSVRHARYSRYQFQRYQPASTISLGRGFVMAIGMTVTAAMGLLYLTHTSELATAGSALQVEEKNLARVSDDTEKLRLQIASLRSLERLERSPIIAQMVDAGEGEKLDTSSETQVETNSR